MPIDELSRVVCELSRALLLLCIALALPVSICFRYPALSSLRLMPIDERSSVVCVDVVRSLGHSTPISACFRYIRAGTELTWDYNYEVGSVPDKVLYCYCGSPMCRGRLL